MLYQVDIDGRSGEQARRQRRDKLHKRRQAFSRPRYVPANSQPLEHGDPYPIPQSLAQHYTDTTGVGLRDHQINSWFEGRFGANR